MKGGTGTGNGVGKGFSFRGTYLLVVVAGIYLLLLIMNRSVALAALVQSRNVLCKIIPIITVIIFFTALINYFLPPGRIVRHLGRESGIIAWIWSLFAGLISHGPMYIWFPLLEELRERGMRDALIVVFFAARTVKIPLLPMMIDYFGWRFTLVLSFYILVGAVAQGCLLEFLEKRD